MEPGVGDCHPLVSRMVPGWCEAVPHPPLQSTRMNATATAHVHTHIQLDLREIPDGMVDQLRGHLTVPNPERQQAVKSGRGADSIPALVQVYRQEGHHLLIPRGAVQLVKQSAAANGVTLQWSSSVVSRSVRRVPLTDLGLTLRDYQRDAVESLVRGVQGYVKAPCGSGKTVIGASALVHTGEPGIVLVHTHDLLRQWVDLFRSWEIPVRELSGRERELDPLRIRHGEAEVVVATVQSVHRLGAKVDPLLQSAGVVILDEAHHAPAGTFREVLERCPARYRWGLTATPHREDGWGVLLPMVLGPERWRISMGELVDLGFLLLPQVYSMESGTHLEPSQFTIRGRVNMARAVNALCADQDRTALLVEVVRHLADQGRTILVLVPRVQYAQDLAGTLRSLGVAAMPVTGSTGAGLRGQRIRGVREGSIQVMVATQLADEGLDVPNLDAVVVASTGRAAGRAVQRIGRVMRTAPGKVTPVVVDVADPTPFSSQWRARARAYFQELGVVVPGPQPWDRIRDQLGDPGENRVATGG